MVRNPPFASHPLHPSLPQLAPVPSGGIQTVDAPSFTLHCLETPTGLKLFVTCKPRMSEGVVPAFLRRVYELYADDVLKNPFYELDMPIRIRLFDHHLEAYVKQTGLGTGSGSSSSAAATGGQGASSSAPAATGGGAASSGGGGAMFTGSSTTAAPMFTGSSTSGGGALFTGSAGGGPPR
jgi:hypothetical protein